jgi:hypothetical protein
LGLAGGQGLASGLVGGICHPLVAFVVGLQVRVGVGLAAFVLVLKILKLIVFILIELLLIVVLSSSLLFLFLLFLGFPAAGFLSGRGLVFRGLRLEHFLV